MGSADFLQHSAMAPKWNGEGVQQHKAAAVSSGKLGWDSHVLSSLPSPDRLLVPQRRQPLQLEIFPEKLISHLSVPDWPYQY